MSIPNQQAAILPGPSYYFDCGCSGQLLTKISAFADTDRERELAIVEAHYDQRKGNPNMLQGNLKVTNFELQGLEQYYGGEILAKWQLCTNAHSGIWMVSFYNHRRDDTADGEEIWSELETWVCNTGVDENLLRLESTFDADMQNFKWDFTASTSVSNLVKFKTDDSDGKFFE